MQNCKSDCQSLCRHTVSGRAAHLTKFMSCLTVQVCELAFVFFYNFNKQIHCKTKRTLYAAWNLHCSRVIFIHTAYSCSLHVCLCIILPLFTVSSSLNFSFCSRLFYWSFTALWGMTVENPLAWAIVFSVFLTIQWKTKAKPSQTLSLKGYHDTITIILPLRQASTCDSNLSLSAPNQWKSDVQIEC